MKSNWWNWIFELARIVIALARREARAMWELFRPAQQKAVRQAEAYAHELALREIRTGIDEFLSITSHKLRTPLTTIKGNVQLARMRLSHIERQMTLDDPLSKSALDEIYTLLNRAERGVNVQNQLIHDMTDITRIQAGNLELNIDLCNLTQIVIDTVEDQHSVSPTRSIKLTLQAHKTLPVIADAERIGQVLSNFLINALQYSSADRSVFISLERLNSAARISVRDEGPGLTTNEQAQVWDRFYKVKGIMAQKGFSEGLGLGLYICRAIIEEHQGEFGVESLKGVGSTFWFKLPLAAPTLVE